MAPTFNRKPLVLCLFAAVGALAYYNILDDFFLSDDFDLIGRVLGGDLFFVWGRSHGGFFRPLFILSYYLDAKAWGRNPAGFHLSNLLAHVLNSFLVFSLTCRLAQYSGLTTSRQKLLPLAAGSLFLLHPSHTEAVSWISGRVDLLATFFCLASLLLYVSYLHTERPSHLILALCSFLLALLAKESAACLPLAALAVGVYIGRGRHRRDPARLVLKAAAPFFFTLAAYIALRAVVLGSLIGGYGAARHLAFTHSVIASQLLRFVIRAVLPAVTLRSFPFLESRKLSPILIAAGAAIVPATAVILTRRRTRRAAMAMARRNSLLWLLSVLFFCSLMPVINLRINVFDTQGERFLYLPTAFSSVALAYLSLKATRRMKLTAILVFSLLCFYAATLRMSNRHWGEAAELSQRLTGDVASLSTGDRIIILNAPDNLRGAYIFRNGIEQAVGTFQGPGVIRPTQVVAYHGLQTPQDQVELTKDSGVFSLRLLNGGTGYENVNPAPECLDVLNHTTGDLQFRLVGCAGTPDILYFSAGRALKLTDQR